MNKEYIYIAYGGTLKRGCIKIGRTDNYKTLYDRYKTYYGDGVKIQYTPVKNSIDVETRLFDELCNYPSSGEIYNCGCKTFKKIFRDLYDNARFYTI
jgi:hypothetical protein